MMSKKTIRMISAVIAIVLVGAMVLGIVASGIMYAGAADADELRTKLSDLEQQKSAIKEELAQLADQVDSAEATSAALANQIDLTQQEIEMVQQYIQRLQNQIDIKSKELEVAEKALDQKYELFCQRIRVMYENGQTSYLDVLLNSHSFADMISRMEIVSQIMDYDQRVVEEYQAAKDDIEAKRDDLQKTQNEQLDYQTNLNYKVDELAQSQAEQQALLTSLAEYQSVKQAEQDAIDAEMQSVSDEIAAQSAAAAAAAGTNNSGSAQMIVSEGGFVWPTPSCTSTSSVYGWRIHPIYGTRKFHAGEDIPASYGAEILATKAGTVTTSGWVSGYGNYTVIDHGGGLMSAYGHQSQRIVSVGDTVSAGQVIGYVGSTGNSTGPHLHFEIYVNGATIDPKSVF